MLDETKKRTAAVYAFLGFSIALNLAMGVFKYVAGASALSLAVMVDGINNALDGVTLAFALLALSLLEKKPTKNYPNGFGRLEHIAAFLMSVAVILVGAGFLYGSIGRIVYPLPVSAISVTHLCILGGTIFVKIGLGLAFVAANKKLPSPLFKLQVADSFLDAGITAAAFSSYLLGAYVSRFPFDGFFGIAISVFVLINGINLLRGAFRRLMNS